jgi:hypothetical protein
MALPKNNILRGYYSPNAKVFEGYLGAHYPKLYKLNINLIESAFIKPFSMVNNYALDNNNNLDNIGNYTANNDQIENDFATPFAPESAGYTAEEILQANEYSEPNYTSGEDVVPS